MKHVTGSCDSDHSKTGYASVVSTMEEPWQSPGLMGVRRARRNCRSLVV